MGFTVEIIRANKCALDNYETHEILMESNASYNRCTSNTILDELVVNSFSSHFENCPSHSSFTVLIADHPELHDYEHDYWFLFELLNHAETDDTVVFLRCY